MTLRAAYVLLWYPKPSETFLVTEVRGLRARGLDLLVFTLYGPLSRGLTPELRAEPGVERLGLGGLGRILGGLGHWLARKPGTVFSLLGRALAAGLGGCSGDRGSLWSRLEKYGENLWALLSSFHLARRFQDCGVTHIHAPWACGPATAAWAASRLTGIPFSFAGRARDVHPPDGLLPEKLRQAAFVRVIARCNAEQLEILGGLPPGTVQLIREILPWPDCPKAAARFAAPLHILGLGRFVGKKGFDDLLRACRLLLDQGLDFRLTLAGDGPERARLLALAERLGLRGRVEFPGFVTHAEARRLLLAADLLAAPCRVEPSGDRDGLPMVLLEALLHCLPVVAADVADIGELVQDGVTGLLVPQRDPESIARAISRLAADRESALNMARAGRQRVRDLFAPEVNLERLEALLQRSAGAEGR
ncbi:MAG TPA: glycosyltransferase [Humidesulfovibrio sp.]|uniref:glycosyltransferase family 4 protein n=1 Tax=Humidesulfovibrio sp. TaxID=2910988 RepID=UPI002BB49614|nr:glycosyltransferase [Humidesulfovibrio sp.]HWR04148.1 glycosyltransferase [Humidesulfovibrio sp.]